VCLFIVSQYGTSAQRHESERRYRPSYLVSPFTFFHRFVNSKTDESDLVQQLKAWEMAERPMFRYDQSINLVTAWKREEVDTGRNVMFILYILYYSEPFFCLHGNVTKDRKLKFQQRRHPEAVS
jgi:hypothetical protein